MVAPPARVRSRGALQGDDARALARRLARAIACGGSSLALLNGLAASFCLGMLLLSGSLEGSRSSSRPAPQQRALSGTSCSSSHAEPDASQAERSGLSAKVLRYTPAAARRRRTEKLTICSATTARGARARDAE